MNVEEILTKLVAIPSVSSMSNRLLMNYICGLLKDCGWHWREIAYHDTHGIEKVNLIAMPGTQSLSDTQVDLAFVCHTDTVPFAQSWTAATSLIHKDGMLHGCGSCDVKGSLACILAAILEMRTNDLQTSVALVLTADEEIGCIGTTRVLEAKVIAPRRVVICEPTSLYPAVAGKGYGLASICISGREAHSAFPQQGVSAISIAAKLIGAIEAWIQQRAGSRNTLFDPPQTTFNIGRIDGGSAKNIIAGSCSFLFEWRPLPEEDPRQIAEELQQIAREVESSNTGCKIEVDIQRSEAGFAPSGRSPLADVLPDMTARPQTGIAFGSEATRFAKVAEEVVVIGPGDMRTAHSERECVPASELVGWTNCLKQLLTTEIHLA